MTGTVLRIIWAPRLIHSVSLSMSVNNASRVCIVLQSRRPFLWIEAKLQKRPVQIRRDGFIIRLKCQLLQKTYPQATLTDRRFELPIIAAKPLQSRRCKTIILALQKAKDQCWISCWQWQGYRLEECFYTKHLYLRGTQISALAWKITGV